MKFVLSTKKPTLMQAFDLQEGTLLAQWAAE